MNFTLLSSVVRRVQKNFSTNPYLHLATAATIAFSLLIIGIFAILYVNINDLIRSWQEKIRVVAYLNNDVSEEQIEPLRQSLAKLTGVEQVVYVSKDEALARLKKQMKHRISLLEGLRENPLPGSFEIQLAQGYQTWQHVDALSDQLKVFPEIDEVESAEAWLHRFSGFIGFFKLASLVIGALIFATTVFVCANTIRLTLFSKRQEIEIMRLVGATDAFVKTPFYIQNLLESLLGGLLALSLLFCSYKLFIARVQAPGALLSACDIRFLSLAGCAILLLIGMLMGWFGSFLSLRHFLRP